MVLLAVSLLGVVGCPDEENGEGSDTGATDVASDTAEDAAEDTAPVDSSDGEADVIDCEPGEIVRCSEENTQSTVVCNAEGDGTEPASCPSKTVCRSGECVDVNCVPGRGRCTEDGPEVCNEAGEEFVDKEACGEGEICEQGACLNRCENAAKTNSYIGCEYWAVELENHLLYESRESGDQIPDENLPPYAIVLANTSDSYKAKVTVWKDENTPAKAIGSRTVDSDVRSPEIVKETVHSELVNDEGQRLLGPINQRLVKVPMPPNSLLTLILPNRQIPNGETSLKKYAYRVESTQPVVAYQFNPYCCNYNYTNDASLLLPASALTENYMYMSYPVWDSPNRQEGDDPESPTVTVLATEPKTEVTVQLRQPRKQGRDYKDVIYPVSDSRIKGPDKQGRLRVEMGEHEVLNIAGNGVGEDLTGARITSDKPVAAFGAHSCTFVPFSKWACDHLESQLMPMETWGQRYIATPLKRRGEEGKFTREGTYWKFLARQNDTTIETGLDLRLGPNGVLPQAGEGVPPCKDHSPNPESGVIELDAGESCEFGTQRSFVASSSKPVLLGAFLSGQESVGDDVQHAGDPSFFIVPPREQYRRSYSFLTPTTYFANFVTVTIPTGFTKLTLDGQEIDLTSYDSYKKFPDLGIARVHIPVDEGPHRISGDAAAFGIVTYGYDDYVSYAYTGGLNLTKYNDIE
jgi:hypothetical protein